MRRHHNTIYCQPVCIIGMPILFHYGECAIYRHLVHLEPFTAALLAIKYFPYTLGCLLTISLFSYRLLASSLNGSREYVDATRKIDTRADLTVQ